MLKIGPGWEGYLTHINIDKVAATITDFLNGNIFAIATVVDPGDHIPSIHTSLHLSGTGIDVVIGDLTSLGYFLRLYFQGRGYGAEVHWNIRTLNGDQVDPQNSVYIWIGHKIISVRIPWPQNTEYVAIAIQ